MSRLYSQNGRPGPEPTTRYSDAEIAEFNRQHDLKNGFSSDLSTVFRNPGRLPETTTLKAEELWSASDETR